MCVAWLWRNIWQIWDERQWQCPVVTVVGGRVGFWCWLAWCLMVLLCCLWCRWWSAPRLVELLRMQSITYWLRGTAPSQPGSTEYFRISDSFVSCVSLCAQIHTFETPILTAYSDAEYRAPAAACFFDKNYTIHTPFLKHYFTSWNKQTNSIWYCTQCTSKK